MLHPAYRVTERAHDRGREVHVQTYRERSCALSCW